MPYIKAADRGQFDDCINRLAALISSEQSETSRDGMVNYIITRIINGGLLGEGITYARLNRAIGVLECAKLELYRRRAAPYEDTKIKENGDVT